MFLHIMVGQNPKKLNAKKPTFLNFIWYDVRIYLCQYIYIYHHVLKKWKYTQKNDWNDF
jgi:hypothetical protein